jgi:glycosyltransferase involved in cell wall biosynthesis
VIFVYQSKRKQLEDLGCPPRKIEYNPCGVDCAQFAGARPDLAPPTFLAVGRLVEKKGPLATLAAFRRVVEEAPAARLRVIGDGRMREATEQLVRQLGIQHAVELLGAQNHDVIRREMQSARAFVQHSIRAASGDCEGTPVAVMEASASALPVVATNHGGIADVVRPGITGYLVEEGDVGSMARFMCVLAADPALAAAMGKRGRLTIEERFTQRYRLDRLSSILLMATDQTDLDLVSAHLQSHPATALSVG